MAIRMAISMQIAMMPITATPLDPELYLCPVIVRHPVILGTSKERTIDPLTQRIPVRVAINVHWLPLVLDNRMTRRHGLQIDEELRPLLGIDGLLVVPFRSAKQYSTL